LMTPISQELESPANPGRFNPRPLVRRIRVVSAQCESSTHPLDRLELKAEVLVSPSLAPECPLEVGTVHTKVLANIRDLGSVRLQRFLSDNTASNDAPARNHPWVSHRGSAHTLLRADELLKVWDAEDVCDRVHLIRRW